MYLIANVGSFAVRNCATCGRSGIAYCASDDDGETTRWLCCRCALHTAAVQAWSIEQQRALLKAYGRAYDLRKIEQAGPGLGAWLMRSFGVGRWLELEARAVGL